MDRGFGMGMGYLMVMGTGGTGLLRRCVYVLGRAGMDEEI